jgi:sterol 3beta-glucosyltransferase
MKKITILTAGTRGDTQPYIALGLALQNAGCQVRIAAFENFAKLVKDCGLDFFPIKGDITHVAQGETGQEAMRADNPLKVLVSFNKLKSMVFDLQGDFYAACRGADAIVYHPGATIGYFYAQQHQIPSILATPFPMTPTAEYPALIFYNFPRLGKGFNRFSHRVFEKIMWSASASAVKRYWDKEFHHLPQDYSCPYRRQVTPRLPTVVSCSNAVFPRPADWPEHVYNTGYWFLDEDAGWHPSPELQAFIDGGQPPVYVGFGSMGDQQQASRVTRVVIDALHHQRMRGVLATGWKGLQRVDNPPGDIFFLESAPHSWLFPRMAALVHHGGAGTTAAGMRTGVPTVVLPFSNDHFAWGRRVFELGVGSRAVPIKHLTVDRLSDALIYALSNETVNAAKALGEKIRNESGVETAAKVIMDSFLA